MCKCQKNEFLKLFKCTGIIAYVLSIWFYIFQDNWFKILVPSSHHCNWPCGRSNKPLWTSLWNFVKFNLEDAFKHVQICAEDWEPSGYTWYVYDPADNNVKLQYYYDCMIQFGATLFNDFAHGANLIMEYCGITYWPLPQWICSSCIPGTNTCQTNLNIILSTYSDLGFAVNLWEVYMILWGWRVWNILIWKGKIEGQVN